MGQLGLCATSGRKRLDRQYRFRVVVGPLSLQAYEDLLPGTVAWRALLKWVQQYAGLDLRWDLQLILAGAHVPEPHPNRRQRLGLTSWIGRGLTAKDRDALRLRPETSFLVKHHGFDKPGATNSHSIDP